MTQLLATTLPSSVSTSEATEFIDRWNRTVQYWSQGIFTAAQVPAGQSTDFLDIGAIQTAFNAAVTAEQWSQVNGYSDVGAEVQGALKQVESDLEGQGVCATIKLQIDQTATLTRSAFSGTLSITNSEGTGAMTNVVMDINITDAQGNPANGEFFISSPSYSGAFSVVNGVATLPDNSTGTITFTFIPDDSAAANGPTQYHIGGTIGFTDPAGGAVTIPVFPSTITVDPQANLQLNYFLQTDVIGDDPFTPQVEPSEPAVLGLLVTNVGGGTANNLSITTAQPQIVQNEKGLLDTFQIIGTQVGNQSETPSLTVNFGDIAPGQTADASFLLLSSLQGVFDNFTATFSHSDALGGTATSLISSVQTHTLIHAGDFNYPDSTGATDYLVDDNPNPKSLPDTIYFSDGTTAPVNDRDECGLQPGRFERRVDLPGHRQRHERLGLHSTPRPGRRIHPLQGRPLGRHRHPGQRPGLDDRSHDLADGSIDGRLRAAHPRRQQHRLVPRLLPPDHGHTARPLPPSRRFPARKAARSVRSMSRSRNRSTPPPSRRRI